MLAYETNDFLVMARCSADEMARAKTILAATNPSRLDVHQGLDAAKASKPLVHAS